MRGVIVDLDETLYPRDRFVRSGLTAVAQHVELCFGIPAASALTAMLTAAVHERGREFQALCHVFGLEKRVLPQLIEVFRTHRPVLRLFPDATASLRQLRADGWRLAILTNGAPQVQALKVQALGLADLVDHVVFAEEHARGGKPHRDAFGAALRRLDLPARRCVMVGDDPRRDVCGARKVGMRTIGIRRNGVGSRMGADIVVDCLGRVPAAAGALIQKVPSHAA